MADGWVGADPEGDKTCRTEGASGEQHSPAGASLCKGPEAGVGWWV